MKLVYADFGASAFSSLSEVLWVRLASIMKLEMIHSIKRQQITKRPT